MITLCQYTRRVAIRTVRDYFAPLRGLTVDGVVLIWCVAAMLGVIGAEWMEWIPR